MGLRIQNNVEAFNAHRQLTGTASKAAKAMEKLASGYRVNRAADDAAGLAISEKMRAQIGGPAHGQRNAPDALSPRGTRRTRSPSRGPTWARPSAPPAPAGSPRSPPPARRRRPAWRSRRAARS